MHPVRQALIAYLQEHDTTLKQLADLMVDVSYNQLTDAVEGPHRMKDPSHLAHPLYHATGYLPFQQALLTNGVRAVKDWRSVEVTTAVVESELLDINTAISVVREKRKEMDADGRRTRSEKQELLGAMEILKQEVMEAIGALEHDLSQEQTHV